MDVHPDNSPGLGLPQPSLQQGGSPVVPPISAPAAPLAVQQTVPLSPAAAPGVQVADSTGDDNLDSLDEEWVSKAKAIVERTKNDPYLESKEISRAKADYLRLRYNKQIKVADEQP